MDALQHFFHMGGHGVYVFSAYGSVLAFLLVQWILPWRRWRHYCREQKKLFLEKSHP